MQSIDRPPPVDTFAQQPAFLPVRFVVLARNDGYGNMLWEPEWIAQVTTAAMNLTQATVELFYTIEWEQNIALYTLNQLELLIIDNRKPPWRWRQSRMLTVVISHPNTTDSAGISATGAGRGAPWFVMRARSGDTPEDTARIFLHELGHQIGYEHIPNSFLGYEDTTDTYYLTDAGRLRLREWVEKLQTEPGFSEEASLQALLPLPPRDNLNAD